MNRNGFSKLALCFLAFIAVSFYSSQGWADKASLSPSDCVKCHEAQPAQVDSNGGRHKSVSCRDCHSGHRPTSKNNIPQCNQCHQGNPHFEQKGCLSCHTNPHTPLKITFAANLTEPCLACHKPQIQQLREHKSKHSLQSCTTCHDVHRKKPACTQCHKPHSTDITAADCTKCHKAHMPKDVTYASDTKSIMCAACHKNQYAVLTASKVKHSTFTCAFCHQEKHKMVPSCKDCHGNKHPEGIMKKFPRCGDCHKIAHDLNNWQSSAPAAAAPKAGTGAKKKGK